MRAERHNNPERLRRALTTLIKALQKLQLRFHHSFPGVSDSIISVYDHIPTWRAHFPPKKWREKLGALFVATTETGNYDHIMEAARERVSSAWSQCFVLSPFPKREFFCVSISAIPRFFPVSFVAERYKSNATRATIMLRQITNPLAVFSLFAIGI